mmetsp:Transcript_24817/g.58626  ORF Transcript_24817/g.58626 Transcript_24817/m.58626 type:complete len:181 (-) Transcript_24817:28-570(-)
MMKRLAVNPDVTGAPHTLSLAYFRQVSNAREITTDVIEKRVSAGVVNASLVVSEFQVLVAASKAIRAWERKQLRTHHVHTELIFSMSGSHNIKDSLNKFGVQDETADVLVAIVDATPEQEAAAMGWVKGTVTDMAQLEANCDVAGITKAFKLTPQELALKGGIESAVVSRIATSESSSHG